jgi:formylglycine-generating enzyme required for sulfatase activity
VQKNLQFLVVTLVSVLLFISGCKSDIIYHELRGGKKQVWFEPVPYGMVYVKPGHFQLGGGDQNLDGKITSTFDVSVNSFWMDETEITNAEYRQYVRWVTDSVAALLTFNVGIEYYKALDRDRIPYDPARVDREKVKGIWRDEKKEVIDALKPIFYEGNERLMGNREIDYRKIFYEYYYIDLKQAAQRTNSFNYETNSYSGSVTDPKTGVSKPITDRSSFIIKNSVPIYPDTLVWVRDFTYSFNEPWTLMYFHHPAFNDYPVVGVTWQQANAFCHWRTSFKDDFLKSIKIESIHPYRLPTEAEWEYAARGGKTNSNYPWGSYYTSSEKGCHLANFKPYRGNYVADSYYSTKTMKVGSFDPNGYGLYDMAGNVAEWTITAYDASGYQMLNSLNPDYQYNASDADPPSMKRKVVRGGSWKDVSFFIRVATRDYEYQDSAKSFVGFRCVMNAIEDERE